MDSKTEKKTAKKPTAKASSAKKSAASTETTPKTRVTRTTRKQATKDAVAAAPIAAPAPAKPSRARKTATEKAEKKPARTTNKEVKPSKRTKQFGETAGTKAKSSAQADKGSKKTKANKALKADKPADTPAAQTTAPAAAPAETPAAAPQSDRTPQAPATEKKEHARVRRESFRPNKERKNDDAPSGFAVPETVGGNDEQQGGKRKRRRRNKRGGQNDDRQPQGATPISVSIKKLHRRAWQIFLGEVTEEGLALMDDVTARETARRAYRVAEFLLMEAERHNKRASLADSSPAAAEGEEASLED